MILKSYDPVFRAHAGRIPVAFLRALAMRESSLNPNENTSPAYGLMQLVNTVRLEYNQLRNTHYSQSDLLNPDINVKIASDLLHRIMTAYARHPDPNMQPNFSNPEFVKLLVAGWNSGYSEGGGVGKVARYLEARGLPVTHDNVFANAGAAGATTHLQNAQKKAWQRSVADLYFSQPDAGKVSLDTSFWAKVGITTAVALLAARYLFR